MSFKPPPCKKNVCPVVLYVRVIFFRGWIGFILGLEGTSYLSADAQSLVQQFRIYNRLDSGPLTLTAFFLCVFVLCVSDTRNETTTCSHLATMSKHPVAFWHPIMPPWEQSSLSLTPATFRMLSQQHTFLPTYLWQPSLMLFRYHTPWSHFPAPYPGSSPRRLQHHTPQCNPRWQSLNPKFPAFKGSNFGTPGCAKMLAMRALASGCARPARLPS